MFSNPILGGTILIRPAIQSPNYVAGTTGWSINADGTAEFNGVTIRGTLQSSNYVANSTGWQLNNSGAAFFNGSVTLGGGGVFRTSAGNPHLEMGPGSTGSGVIQFVDSTGTNAGTIQVPGPQEIDILAGFTAASSLKIFNGGAQLNSDATTGTSTVQAATVTLTASNGNVNINASSAINLVQTTGMNDHPLRMRTPFDGNHYVAYDSGIDGVTLAGHARVRMFVVSPSQFFDFEGDGGLHAGQWAIASFGGLGNGFLGGTIGGSGGGLITRAGGHGFSVDWTSSLLFYIENVNVKTFVIPHPNAAEKYLVHACIEGPEAAVFYRGTAQLEDGRTIVELPAWFEALCDENGRSVQLTCIAEDVDVEWCPALHATYPKEGRFAVGLGSGVQVRDQRFWWEVKARRRGTAFDPEPLRSAVEVEGSGPYTWTRKVQS